VGELNSVTTRCVFGYVEEVKLVEFNFLNLSLVFMLEYFYFRSIYVQMIIELYSIDDKYFYKMNFIIILILL